VPFSSAIPRRAIRNPRYRNNRCSRIELAHLLNTTAMRALVTAAPVFQDAGNAHAAPARRLATSIDTSDWRGCGEYDASYSTCHNSFAVQTLMRCLTNTASKYTLTPQGPACPPGLFCAISGQFFDCIPYSGGTVRTTCVDMLSTCSNCDNGYYESWSVPSTPR
jgi:hypothetical protein